MDDKPMAKSLRSEKDGRIERKKNGGTPSTQLTAQKIASLPALMDTPINPPAVVPQPSKGSFDRMRPKLLPPRFAKQMENNRLQKMHQGMYDVNDMNKVNHNINMYIKDGPSAPPGPIINAWDKPLMRSEQESALTVGIDNSKSLEKQPTSQNSTAVIDKVCIPFYLTHFLRNWYTIIQKKLSMFIVFFCGKCLYF